VTSLGRVTESPTTSGGPPVVADARSRGVPPLVEPGPPLEPEEVTRYSMHLLLPQLGQVAQRRLRNARVCVVGAGGLGAPVVLYLAAAGVGRLGIVDDDDVELSNLQRQVLHTVADVGRAKVRSAARAVHALDPSVQVTTHHVRLDEDTVDLLSDYDVVVDGTDNFATRYLVNDACVRLGIPEVWGSVYRFDAQVAVFWGRPPAGVPPVQLRDLFPRPPAPGTVPGCAEGGVLGAMCGQVGSVMATEVVKLVTGVGQPLLGRVLVLDALAARWTEVPLVGDPQRSASVPTRPAEEPPVEVGSVSPRELVRLLDQQAVTLVDVREAGERDLVSIPGSVHVPLADVLAGRDGAVPEGRPVVLHCRSGVRSEQAARSLLAAGRPDVTHLAGGILAWVEDVAPHLPRY
jgi:sulfur-carrier protein adenylyltransferase/sulfurtransferase